MFLLIFQISFTSKILFFILFLMILFFSFHIILFFFRLFHCNHNLFMLLLHLYRWERFLWRWFFLRKFNLIFFNFRFVVICNNIWRTLSYRMSSLKLILILVLHQLIFRFQIFMFFWWRLNYTSSSYFRRRMQDISRLYSWWRLEGVSCFN